MITMSQPVLNDPINGWRHVLPLVLVHRGSSVHGTRRYRSQLVVSAKCSILCILHTTPLTTLRPRWWGLWPWGEGRGCVPDEAGREGSGSHAMGYV